MISVVLADDQALVRGAIAALLELEGDIEVVAQASNGRELLNAVQTHHPQVAVVDIEMPDLDGIAATKAITETTADTKTLILTTFGRPGYLKRALRRQRLYGQGNSRRRTRRRGTNYRRRRHGCGPKTGHRIPF